MASTGRSASAVIVLCLILQLARGTNFYWQPNTNWGNPSNWALGRVPDCRDAASLTSVPDNSVIFLDTDVTVQSISLPANGQLVLGSSVTIRLSPDSDCTVPGDTEPMAAAIQNEFTGASPSYWECAGNWLTDNDVPVVRSPCGDDNAIFNQEAFNVKANETIFVRSLRVRGATIQSQDELSDSEFDLTIEINSECGDNPDLCPCPDDSLCPQINVRPTLDVRPTLITRPTVVVSGETKGPDLGGIIGGVIFGVVVVIVIVSLLVIFAVILYLRNRPTAPYVKDELLDEQEGSPPTSSSAAVEDDIKNPFANPLYEEEEDVVKVDLGATGDIPQDTPPGMTSYEVSPQLYASTEEDEKHVPKLNKYERF